jgi:hypothetical protein
MFQGVDHGELQSIYTVPQRGYYSESLATYSINRRSICSMRQLGLGRVLPRAGVTLPEYSHLRKWYLLKGCRTIWRVVRADSRKSSW